MQFMQNGRKVFKEVLPLVSQHIADHMAAEGVGPTDLTRLWLHQANKAMNDFIGRKVMGRVPAPEEQPNILGLRQHLFRRVDHRVFAAFRGHDRGPERADLFLRSGVFGRLRPADAAGRLSENPCFLR
jgi:beta-ketodecanoyl-[acyl-carrier-protein] synthase